MDVKSKDMKVEDALPLFAAMLTVEEVKGFLSEDETRKTIIEAADARIKEIEAEAEEKSKAEAEEKAKAEAEEKAKAEAEEKAKQGKVKTITQPVSDFKDGVQAMKEAGTPPPPAPPYQGGEKGEVKVKTYVSGEDVIKQMRAKGIKI